MKSLIPDSGITNSSYDKTIFSMKLDKEIRLTKVNNSASRFSLKSNNTMKRSKVKRNGVRLTEFKLIKKDVLIS